MADKYPAPSNETASKQTGNVNAAALTKLCQPETNTGLVKSESGQPLVFGGTSHGN